jgi:hypothetical protein
VEQARPLVRTLAFRGGRGPADRLREPGGSAAGAVDPQAKGDRRPPGAGCADGNLAATGHRRKPGPESSPEARIGLALAAIALRWV